jgi:serine/threonine protein kinase
MGCSSSAPATASAGTTPQKRHSLYNHLVRTKKRQNWREHYEIIELVGKGAIGCVYKVKRKKKQRHSFTRASFAKNAPSRKEVIYAVKEIDLELVDSDVQDSMRNEVELLSKIDHPNIVKVFEVYEDEEHRVAIVMELCSGGELYDRAP